MITRTVSGGARQHAWDKLHERDFKNVLELATAIGATADGLRGYIAALEKRGYVLRRSDGSLHMLRHTGPRAPSFSVHTDDFRDWNLDPAMSGATLQQLVRSTGLSDAGWLAAANMPPTNSTRLRQMMNGQRPVSGQVAEAAQRLAVPET